MRRALVAALAVASAVTTVAALDGQDTPAVASVTTDQAYPVPASGVYRVTGHGYGHGHGLSQYGARGAALQGRNAQQILGFYYPGTTRGTVADGLIRVLVSADTDDPVVVLPRSGLRVRDRGAGATYVLPRDVGATRWRLRAATASADRLDYWDGAAWRPWKVGGSATLQGTGAFSSADGPVTLRTPSGNRAYRGSLRSAAPAAGSTARDTVNVVTLDDYVKGVIAAEMPASWPQYALRAQAVAARTYAVFDRDAHYSRYYQICDTTACQVYAGVASEHPATNAAAEATAGQVRLWNGKPAFTQFSSSSGGWTSAGSFPYLAHQADPYDAPSGNPNRTWTKDVSAATIRNAYPGIGRLLRVRVTRREGGGDWQGRVERLRLEGTRSTRILTGDEFRSAFGLKSTWFRL